MFYKELSAWDIKRELEAMDRDYFSLEAINLLIELTDDNGEELDVIAICCDYTEYNKEDLIMDYGYLIEDYQDEEEELEALLDVIEDYSTYYLLSNGNYLVVNF